MEKDFFNKEVELAIEQLRAGHVILYPTDTIWGIGCDATRAEAIDLIYAIKKRPDSKSMIILAASDHDILKYVATPDLSAIEMMKQAKRPTTVIFQNAIGLADNLIAEDGSVAIRLVKDEFCRHLIKRLGKPIVSTSANVSGEPSPANYREVAPVIKDQVHHVVQWRQDDITVAQPSRIIKWHHDGNYEVIRP